MIAKLKSLLFGQESGSRAGASSDEVNLAATALMIEAAMMDGNVAEEEKAKILSLLSERLGLTPWEAQALYERAARSVEASSQLYPFAKTIVTAFSSDQRVEMLEMIWQVVYADGRLHDYEANLVRRVAGLLYVSDQECGLARRRALVRLGQPDVSLT